MSRLFNKCREASEWNSPPQMRRGGCAVKKKSRSHLSPRRRGGVDKPNTFCGPTPPRPLHQRWLRSFFLDVVSTPPQLRRAVPFRMLRDILGSLCFHQPRCFCVPTSGDLNFNINTGTFGQIMTKTGNRIQTQIRLDF